MVSPVRLVSPSARWPSTPLTPSSAARGWARSSSAWPGSSVPIAGISIAIGAATAAFSAYRNAQKEVAENTREMTEAFEEGIGSADEWADAIDEAFATGTAGGEAFSREMLRALETALSPEQFVDLRKGMADIGVTFEDLGQIAKDVEADFTAYAASSSGSTRCHRRSSRRLLGPMVDEWGGAEDILLDLNNQLAQGAPTVRRLRQRDPHRGGHRLRRGQQELHQWPR